MPLVLTNRIRFWLVTLLTKHWVGLTLILDVDVSTLERSHSSHVARKGIRSSMLVLDLLGAISEVASTHAGLPSLGDVRQKGAITIVVNGGSDSMRCSMVSDWIRLLLLRLVHDDLVRLRADPFIAAVDLVGLLLVVLVLDEAGSPVTYDVEGIDGHGLVPPLVLPANIDTS